ncbi:MAG: hypothetical protein CMC15_14110 [Flavobacteriaceae bacterium]|nr:hypothetical protein [Flavobacteriaceae bacterium]
MTKNINRKLQNLLDGESSRPVTGNATSAVPLFPLVYKIEIPGGGTSNQDITVAEKCMVIDAYIVNNAAGASSDTVQVTNGTGSNHITNAMSNAGAAGAVVAASSLHETHRNIAAGATLRVTQTDASGSNSAATSCYIIVLRTA